MVILTKLSARVASLALSLSALGQTAMADRAPEQDYKTGRIKNQEDRGGYIHQQRERRHTRGEVLHPEQRIAPRHTRETTGQGQHPQTPANRHSQHDTADRRRQRDGVRHDNRRDNRHSRHARHRHNDSHGYHHRRHDSHRRRHAHSHHRDHYRRHTRPGGYHYYRHHTPRRYAYHTHRPYLVRSPRLRYHYNREYVPRYHIGGYYGYHPNTIIIGDYGYWGLYAPPQGYHWVHDHDNGDAILASVATGAIIGLVIGALAH